MQIHEIIILYIFGLLLELGLSLTKWKILTVLPVIVSCIVFLITKEENFYILAFYQIIVAFVKYNGNHKHSRLKTQSQIYTSERCYNIGNFSNYGLSYKEGYISLVCIELNYNNHSSFFIQSQLSIGQGDSGSPLFNEKNEIIGMITFRTKGLSDNVKPFIFCLK